MRPEQTLAETLIVEEEEDGFRARQHQRSLAPVMNDFL